MDRAKEIHRVYRLDLDNGEADWDDPMPPDITAHMLGRSATSLINRTSLLAWALMSLPEVEVADLAFDGWIKIHITTDPAFDEVAFKDAVAAVVARVRQVPRYQEHRSWRGHKALGSALPRTAGLCEARAV